MATKTMKRRRGASAPVQNVWKQAKKAKAKCKGGKGGKGAAPGKGGKAATREKAPLATNNKRVRPEGSRTSSRGKKQTVALTTRDGERESASASPVFSEVAATVV